MTRKKNLLKVLPADRQKSCGKNRYNSRQEAETVAREQEIINASEELKLEVYHCALCGGWHLTRSSIYSAQG